MTQPTDHEVLDEAFGKIEIASSMSADDFGRYWIEGIPEAKKLLTAHFAKKLKKATEDGVNSAARYWEDKYKNRTSWLENKLEKCNREQELAVLRARRDERENIKSIYKHSATTPPILLGLITGNNDAALVELDAAIKEKEEAE